MTDMTRTYNRKSEQVEAKPTATPIQTVITAQQVLFNTAAAIALPPVTTRWWRNTLESVSAALRAVFAASEKPPARRHYPKRHAWLENGVMAREMDRL